MRPRRARGLGRQIPNPELLIAPYVRREAVLSSRIEGTQASLDDLLRVEAGEPVGDPADVREVAASSRRSTMGARCRSPSRSAWSASARHPHAGRPGRAVDAGRCRPARTGSGRAAARSRPRVVAPPPDRMKQALHDWELFLHQRDALPDLVQCALVHEQFEAIHPFLDGNGRVGRLLVTLFLVERERYRPAAPAGRGARRAGATAGGPRATRASGTASGHQVRLRVIGTLLRGRGRPRPGPRLESTRGPRAGSSQPVSLTTVDSRAHPPLSFSHPA